MAADCSLGWAECREVMLHPLKEFKEKVTILVQPLLPLRCLKDDSGPQETPMLLTQVWCQYILYVHVIGTQFTWCNTGSTCNTIPNCCRLEVWNCAQSGEWNSKCRFLMQSGWHNPDFWHLQHPFHQLPVGGSVSVQHPFVSPAVLRASFYSVQQLQLVDICSI